MEDLSNIRIGRVTSSEIVALTSNGTRPMTEQELKDYKKENPSGRRTTIDDYGAPFYTYVEECRMERFFKQSLDRNVEVFAFAWGKCCEVRVHNLLGLSYRFHSNVTYIHPTISEWVGTPDGSKLLKKVVDTVTDTKCPSSKKGFFNLIKRLYDFDGLIVTKKKEIDGNKIIQLIRRDSKEGEKYYWQLVSNACILGAKYAELIVYMPYYEELELIKDYNRSLPEEKQFWLIERAKDEELPYIMKETGIENLNVIRFEVPEEDKKFLESRVLTAVEKINE